jgi:murein DD-endopeptidase MepM/ murein hydrolase activator NlpD
VKKSTIYALFFVFVLLFSASFGEDTSNEQRKLIKIQSELAEQKQKLRITRVEEQRALSSLYVIKKNLMRAKKSLSEAKVRVDYNQKKMSELRKESAAAEASIQDESGNLRRRIREVYKSGSGGFLDILFASRSMSDFINRTYYFGRIINKDVELIGIIRQQVEQIRSARSQLESSNREIKDSLQVIETQKREIVRADADGQRVYKALHSRRQDYEHRVRELEASSLEFERFIKARGKSKAVSSGKFGWPISGRIRIVSKFGFRIHPIWGRRDFHTGIDIAAPYGKPIMCADSGEVIYSGWWDGYGKAVVIDHGRGYTTVYGHMSRILVQTGQKMEKGQMIGLVGSTGFATGPHLHFEIRYNGRPIDPLPYLI